MSGQPPTRSRARLLSNGRYTVMLNESGAGSSRWRELAVTRWREDPTSDPWGSFVLLRDVASGAVWSAGRRPCGGEPDAYDVTFREGRAEIARRDGTLATTLEVAVPADHDAELRRVTVRNHGDTAREIELTSYAELVLGSAAADAAHPAFSKMFVQTEVHEELVLATRRRRTPDDPEIWAAHVAVSDAPSRAETEIELEIELETDRARFLGRGRSLRDAAAMEGGRLSGTVGTVLDPIFSLRRRVIVAPGAAVRVAFWTLVAGSRDAAVELGRLLGGAGTAEAALASAVAHASRERTRLGLDVEDAERHARQVTAFFHADPGHRAAPEVLARARGGAPVLWTAGISGDRPIALVRVAGEADLDEARDLLRAQLYWRSHRLGVDVVLLDARSTRDGESLAALAHAQAAALAATADAAPASVFSLRDDEMSAALRDGLATAARLILPARPPAPSPSGSPRSRAPARRPARPIAPGAPREDPEPLELDNGTGGFARNGREYVIRLPPGGSTPAPWINVIASPSFGFIVSAEGGGYTWSINSQQNPLTPWPNDPVSDRPHEILYLRDEETGELWSATALPIRLPTATYVARHGMGYSRFTHVAHGIEVDLLQTVAVSDPVKLSRLRLCNRSGRPRRLSITAYVEWALGPIGSAPGAVRRDVDRSGHRRGPGAQRVARRARRARGVPGSRWRAAVLHRRPQRVPRPRRGDRAAGGAGSPGAPVGSGRRRPRSLRGPADRRRAPGRLGDRAPDRPGRRRLDRRGDLADRQVPGGRPRGGAARGRRAVGRGARHRRGQDSRSRDGPPPRPLAALPDARLSAVGALGVLPVERRLRLPRSAPGCDGAVPRPTGPRARPAPASVGSPVRRRRCPALVAAPRWPGRAHPDQR